MSKIAIPCPTEDIWIQVENKAFENNILWSWTNSEYSSSKWYDNKDDSCLFFFNNRITFGTVTYAKSKGIKIIKPNDYLLFGEEAPKPVLEKKTIKRMEPNQFKDALENL